MQTNLIAIELILPEPLLERLTLAAEAQGVTLAQEIERILEEDDED